MSNNINKLSVDSSIKILISLVELAQKKGAYSIEESYMAFHAIHTFLDQKNYDNVYNFINQRLENNENNTKSPL
jgi:hypothetical protein